jgi:hypothetical protein
MVSSHRLNNRYHLASSRQDRHQWHPYPRLGVGSGLIVTKRPLLDQRSAS